MAVIPFRGVQTVTISTPSLDTLFYNKAKALIERTSFVGGIKLQRPDTPLFCRGHRILEQFSLKSLPPVLIRRQDHANPRQTRPIRQQRRCRNHLPSIANASTAA